MDAQIELNSSIESTIEKEKSESILLDIVPLNLSKGKRKVLRVLLKALGIDFKENMIVSSAKESPYNEEFEAAMKRSEEDIKEGRVRVVENIKDIWNTGK